MIVTAGPGFLPIGMFTLIKFWFSQRLIPVRSHVVEAGDLLAKIFW